MRHLATVSGIALFVVSLAGCQRHATVPPAAKAVLDARRATAEAVALDAAKLCPSMKGRVPITASTPPPPPNPALGTALESDPQVQDVLVMCVWTSATDPSMSEGDGIPSLKKSARVPARAVTMPEDRAETTCLKSPRDCEEVIVPSRYSARADTADLKVVRPTPDGGTVELTMVIVP